MIETNIKQPTKGELTVNGELTVEADTTQAPQEASSGLNALYEMMEDERRQKEAEQDAIDNTKESSSTISDCIQFFSIGTDAADEIKQIKEDYKSSNLKALIETFKKLSKDPNILQLQKYLKSTNHEALCISTYHQDSLTGPTYERGIALTGDGFRIIQREDERDRASYLSSRTFKQRRFPFNRLLSSSLKSLANQGDTPDTVIEKLNYHISELAESARGQIDLLEDIQSGEVKPI